jgi:hypothetical protein
MFHAPLVVPDLLALLFKATLELFRSSVAVIGSSFALFLQVLQLVPVRL